MAAISFDDLQKAVDDTYAHLEIEFDDIKLKFVNVLQLASETRTEIEELIKSMGGDDEESESGDEKPEPADKPDETEIIKQALRKAADDAEACDLFFEKVGDNAGFIVHTFNTWFRGTEVPEA